MKIEGRRNKLPVIECVDERLTIGANTGSDVAPHDLGLVLHHRFDAEAHGDRRSGAFWIVENQGDMGDRLPSQAFMLIKLAETIAAQRALRAPAALACRAIEAIEPRRAASHDHLDEINQCRFARAVLAEDRRVAPKVEVGTSQHMPLDERDAPKLHHAPGSSPALLVGQGLGFNDIWARQPLLEAGDEIVASDRNDQRPDRKFHVLRVILIVPEMNDRPSLQQPDESRNSLTDSDALRERATTS